MGKHSFIDRGADMLIFTAGVSFLLTVTAFLVKLYEEMIFSILH
jgi:hypothetical protein